MEKLTIENPFHEHPLILRESVGNEENLDCYVCAYPIGRGEWVYVCLQEKQCSSSEIIFHRLCGELPKQISHPSHPQHPLSLVDYHRLVGLFCNLCYRSLLAEVGYGCFRCSFNLDLTCSINEMVGEPRQLQHPRHVHPLTLMRKTSPFEFHCDACGTKDIDMVYACSLCELLIHKACALLPPLLSTNHHHHQLSLSSSFPFSHRNHIYQCGVCVKDLDFVSWVYYCGDCRFFVHIKCATSEKQSNLEQEKEDNGSILIQFPLEECEISKELIAPFVIRENGLDKIPDVKDMPNAKEFNYHVHTLSFVLELSDEADNDDEEELKNKICNVCITPISSLPYYECASCNYFVHSVCCLLPKKLSSLEARLYGNCPETYKNHNFTLYATSKMMDVLWCNICDSFTNGMVYQCEDCNMNIDVRCVCLPTTIKNASHPNHKFIKTRIGKENQENHYWCRSCRFYKLSGIIYLCTVDDSDFALCLGCILLPKSVMKREWDKHPLPLTFDASVDHPTDFYCGFCETEIHPKEWMYHCPPCDNSFHPQCLETESGRFKNIKLGDPFKLNRIHPHTLAFSYITQRKWCNICHQYAYKELGFVCSSCYYVACRICGEEELRLENKGD